MGAEAERIRSDAARLPKRGLVLVKAKDLRRVVECMADAVEKLEAIRDGA